MADRPPPSALAVAFASAIVAGLAGYFLGQASTIGVFSHPAEAKAGAGAGAVAGSDTADSSDKAKAGHDESDISDAKSASGSDDDDDEDDEDDDDLDNQELNGFEDSNEECKLVLVVRTDLGMTKGELS